MDNRARLLAALLAEPVASVISLCRVARMWPSDVKFFLATEHRAKRLKLVGATLPDRRGRTFDLFVVADKEARSFFEKERKKSAAVSWGSLVETEMHDDLLEPPFWTISVIANVQRIRAASRKLRKERLATVESEYLKMSATPDPVYDDSGRGDRVCVLYRRLARATIFLVRAETDESGPAAPTLFREFEELAGELLLMGEWHARYIAKLSGFWRESPLRRRSDERSVTHEPVDHEKG